MRFMMVQSSEQLFPHRAAAEKVCVSEPPFLSKEACDRAFRWKQRDEMSSCGVRVGAPGSACPRGQLSPSCPGLRSPTVLPSPVLADKLALRDLSYPSLAPREFSWL